MPKKIGTLSKSSLHNALVNQIIIALCQTKLGRFWQQPTGAAFRKDKLIRYGLVGCADISGILIGGLRIEIEVKTGNAKQSKQQKNFEQMIKDFDGHYFVVRSVDEALDSVKSIFA